MFVNLSAVRYAKDKYRWIFSVYDIYYILYILYISRITKSYLYPLLFSFTFKWTTVIWERSIIHLLKVKSWKEAYKEIRAQTYIWNKTKLSHCWFQCGVFFSGPTCWSYSLRQHMCIVDVYKLIFDKTLEVKMWCRSHFPKKKQILLHLYLES